MAAPPGPTELSVAIAIALVHLGKTLHPPGKATALIAAVGWPGRGSAGYLYVLLPVELGVTVLLLAGLALDNLPKGRRYSELWL